MADKKKEMMKGELTKKLKERDNQLDEIYEMMGTAHSKAKKATKKSFLNR